MPPRFDAIGIVADDLDAALGFYELLGLDVPLEREDHVEVEMPNGVRLMFDSIEVIQSFSEWSPPTGGNRRVALAFLCESSAEVDEVHARIVGAGHRSHVAPFDAPWGQRYASVIDPDGNPVDLFAALS